MLCTLEAFREANVQLRRDKCKVGMREGEFVGHVVAASGHSPLPSLVDKISRAARPGNCKELQRFLGLVNYYREYIPNMADVTQPLYDLTKKGKDWVWDGKCESAFCKLRGILSDSPIVLAYPDWKKEFYLQTDASTIAVGGVLSQENENGHLKPIAFFSSGLSSTQRNYSAGELECWALIAASRKWRNYVLGAKRIIFLSDHNPLCWLRNQRDPRNKFARWIQELETFDYQIRYVKGTSNQAADYLSRQTSELDPVVNDEFECFERHLYLVKDDVLSERFSVEQREYVPIAFALEQLQKGMHIGEGRFKNQSGMVISDGLLYRGKQLVVPPTLKQEVLALVHNGSHLGIAKTKEAVKRDFYWKGMSQDIEEFCRKCLVCSHCKHKTQPKERLIPLRIADQPRDCIAFDIATLPWAQSGYRYLLLITDLFSKFVELEPMTDQTAGSVCLALKRGWIHRHGPPRIALSDQGPNVDGQEVREMLASFGVEKRHSSPYHPERDGQSERGIQSIKQILRCSLEETATAKGNWPSKLREVAYVYNTSPNASSGFSPYQVMYGSEPKTLGVQRVVSSVVAQDSVSVDDWCNEEVLNHKTIDTAVGRNLDVSRRSMKDKYDVGKSESKAEEGDLVLVKDNTRVDCLDPHYKGPYRVLRRLGVNVKVERGEEDAAVVHLNRCKLYRPSDTVSTEPVSTAVSTAAPRNELPLRRSGRTSRKPQRFRDDEETPI